MRPQSLTLRPWDQMSPIRLDRVVMTLCLIGVGLAIVAPEQAMASVAFTLRQLLAIAPFLLVSVSVAAGLKAADAEQLIARVFAGRQSVIIVTASLFGALSPFCSCGVIPLIAALLAMGIPLAPVMAFWTASPVMSPSMYILMAGTLGVGFASAKTIAAIGVGLLAGFSTLGLQRFGWLSTPLRTGVNDGG